jgi:hypothetical protein
MVNFVTLGEGVQTLREDIEQSSAEELASLRTAIKLWPQSARKVLALAILDHLSPTLH